jgi:hypothetical protein
MHDNSGPAKCDDEKHDSRPQRVYTDGEDALLDNNTAVRVLGILTLLIGCGLGHSGVYSPMSKALANHQTIIINSGAVGGAFIAIVGGTIMLIAGRHTRKLLVHKWRNATVLNVVVSLAIVAIAIVCDRYFQQLLAGLGYELKPLP